MKRFLGIVLFASTILVSQEHQMTIHRAGTFPLIVATSDIDSITFTDTTSARNLIASTQNPFSQFKATQAVYEAENGIYSSSFEELGLVGMFDSNLYFSFAAAGVGGIEATLKTKVGEFSAGSVVGMKMDQFSGTVIYYGSGSFDSSTVDSCFREFELYR